MQKYFLSEARRIRLIHGLMDLSMERTLAEEFASYPDGDLGYIDRNLAFHVHYMTMRSQALAGATTRPKIRTLKAFIAADRLVIGSYVQEIKAREIPRERFPRTTRAMEADIAAFRCLQ